MTRAILVVASLVLFMSQTVADAAGREILADHAMVATSHKKAVAVGIDILKKGGNAVDAAIAMNAVMGVVEPMSNGVGGDLYAIVWDAKTQKMYGLNASGRSPYAATIDYFEKHNLKEIPKYGPLSWSVPGAVDGWDQLRKRFGTMTWPQLLGPAIECAEQGVEVPETIGGFWHLAEPTLRSHPDAAKTFLVNGKAPRVGDVFVNTYIAKTLRTIAEGGRDAYYKGPIARQIVDFSNANGGLFSRRDFEETASTWVEPVSTTYRGKRVWEIPPPGQGIATLQMLNLIEPFDVRAMGPGSADWLQLFIETKRLAYADRARYYTDPDFARVPVSQLISKEYAQSRHGLIDLRHAAPHFPPGDVALGGDTIYLCVVDKDRNCVSLIQSNYNGFGSGLVPGDLGFALQNRGTLFALDRNHTNHL